MASRLTIVPPPPPHDMGPQIKISHSSYQLLCYFQESEIAGQMLLRLFSHPFSCGHCASYFHFLGNLPVFQGLGKEQNKYL